MSVLNKENLLRLYKKMELMFPVSSGL